MITIAVLGQKGGSGKTTASINIARGLQLSGASVVILDTDRQGSARDWHNANNGDMIPVLGLDRPTVDKDIKNINGYDIAIIDGAAQIKDMTISCVKAADFVLIPIQPSQLDIWATSDLIELIQERQSGFNRPKAAFIVSRQISGSNAQKEIRSILNDTGFKVFNNGTFQRMDYVNSIANGKTAFETTGKAKLEVTKIVNELMEFIENE